MQPIVTDLSSVVCQSVCHSSEPCKNGLINQGAIWVENSGGPKESRIGWVQIPEWEWAVFRGKGRPIVR